MNTADSHAFKVLVETDRDPDPETTVPGAAPEEDAPEESTPGVFLHRRPPRWKRFARSLGQWGLFVALAFAAVTGVGALRAPDLPDMAPDFALENLAGETVRLSDFRGRTVVLNFWATWCPPCRLELPSFVRFAKKNPEITVLGLSVQSPEADLHRAVEERGIPYPVLIVDGEMAESYGVSSLPTTIIVDPEGRVRSAHSGVLFGPQLWWMTR